MWNIKWKYRAQIEKQRLKPQTPGLCFGLNWKKKIVFIQLSVYTETCSE